MSTSFSPAAVMFFALALSGFYVLFGMTAFGYAKPDHKRAVQTGAWRVDPWWAFRKGHYEPAGERLRGPGKLLFILGVIALLHWALLITRSINAAG